MRNGVCFKELCDKCFGNLIASFLVISCASLSQINNQCVELSIKIIIECNIQIRCITLLQSKIVVSYCCNSNINKHTKFPHFWYRTRNGLTIILISMSLLRGIYFYEVVFSLYQKRIMHNTDGLWCLGRNQECNPCPYWDGSELITHSCQPMIPHTSFLLLCCNC